MAGRGHSTTEQLTKDSLLWIGENLELELVPLFNNWPADFPNHCQQGSFDNQTANQG